MVLLTFSLICNSCATVLELSEHLPVPWDVFCQHMCVRFLLPLLRVAAHALTSALPADAYQRAHCPTASLPSDCLNMI
ncbi:hypothetical protein BC826DRAFT_980957 [Russula brevipes]|nr:hypothetical protein BC826DRAFT_980957 [Russula brevipes]